MKKKTEQEVFADTIIELGFAGYKPSQMTNSDYWLCTCTAMRKYAYQESKADSIKFALWISKNEYSKRKYTHPNHIGKWFSIIQDTGYLSDEGLYEQYKKERDGK